MDLSQNEFTQEAVADLMESLTVNTELSQLLLRNNELDEDDAGSIGEALPRCRGRTSPRNR